MILEKVQYTARIHTTGGRDGAAHSDDGRLAVKLSTPGASGTGTNPEQLFAAGWSTCFIGAMRLAAAIKKITLPADPAIDAEVDLGTTGGDYFLRASTQRQPARSETRNCSVPGGRSHIRPVQQHRRRDQPAPSPPCRGSGPFELAGHFHFSLGQPTHTTNAYYITKV
jgi:Ohr subfamily peroxiredoxin